MKQIIILTFFFLLIFRSLNSFSQYVEFYAQIEDASLVPKSIKDEITNDIVLKSQNDDLNALLENYKIEKFEQAFPTAPTAWLRKIYKVKCDKKELGEKLKTKFKEKIPLVEYLCEPDHTYTPNDYGLAGGQTNLDLINAKDAWDICKDIPKINIAVTDTYFDLSHEDLNMTLVGGSNNPNVSDDYHGTFVAGCIAAITDNNRGLASVGFNTPLFVSTIRTENEVLRLAQAGYRVINCSWENSCNYSHVQDSIYTAIRNIHNAVVVFGAGNADWRHCGNNNPAYPGSYSSNIAVTSVGHIFNVGTQGSVDWKDVHEPIVGDSLSAHKHHPTMDICAPGYHVNTTDIMGRGYNNGNYDAGWGTSFAAPQVSATLGLIISVNPCLSANEAVDILLSTTDNSIYNIPENSRYIGRLGTGRLDVYAAVNAAAEYATTYLQNQTLSGNQSINSNYAIRAIGNVTVPSGANVNLITRKEVTLNGPFEVATGAAFSINVNVNNVINCN